MSDYRDSNEYYTFPILFIKAEGGDVSNLPDKQTQGKAFVTGDNKGDMKLLEPTTVAKGFEWEYTEYRKTMYELTGTVVIAPEDFKGGDVSGATIRNYYDPAIQQAKLTEPLLRPFIKQVIAVVREAFGLSEYTDPLKAKKLKIKGEVDIYVPRNISEEITLINQSAAMGSISVQTASERNKFGKTDEYERILKEISDNLKQENGVTTSVTGNEPV